MKFRHSSLPTSGIRRFLVVEADKLRLSTPTVKITVVAGDHLLLEILLAIDGEENLQFLQTSSCFRACVSTLRTLWVAKAFEVAHAVDFFLLLVVFFFFFFFFFFFLTSPVELYLSGAGSCIMTA